MSNNFKGITENNIISDIEKLKSKFAEVLGGDFSSLKTVNKSFVGAINEIYTAIENYVKTILTGLTISGSSSVSGTSSSYTCTPTPSTATYNGVNWSVSGSAATINNSGVITVKNTAWKDSIVVKAVSKDNSNIVATKDVTVSYPMSVNIVGDNDVNIEGQYSLSVTPAKASDEAFTWSITSGSDYATISQSGVVTVNEGVEGESITIKATSAYGSATKTLTVSNVVSNEKLLFQVNSLGGSSYTSPIMAQNTGLTEWTVLMNLNCSGVGSTACWVDEGASIGGSFPQNTTGAFTVTNYNWGAANFTMCIGNSWIVGEAWNPPSPTVSNLKYAITRSGNTVKYSTNGTTWTTVNVSSWNTTGHPLTVGCSYGDKNIVPSPGKIDFRLYDTSELSAGTLSEFFS